MSNPPPPRPRVSPSLFCGGLPAAAVHPRVWGILLCSLFCGGLRPPRSTPTYEQTCAAWLLAHLAAAGGPVRPSEVVEAARLAGFPRPTLYRARQALGDQVVDVGNSRRDPNKRWVLAGSADAGQAP